MSEQETYRPFPKPVEQVCIHCGSKTDTLRETFRGDLICVDSESCAKRWMAWQARQ